LGKGEFGHGGKDTAKNICWLIEAVMGGLFGRGTRLPGLR
jgi:hypothetical protein